MGTAGSATPRLPFRDAFTMHVRNSNLLSFYTRITHGLKDILLRKVYAIKCPSDLKTLYLLCSCNSLLHYIVIVNDNTNEVFLVMNVANTSQYMKADGRALRNTRRISKIFHLVNCRVNCHNYHTVSPVLL